MRCALPLLLVCACNDPLIDPSDAVVHETQPGSDGADIVVPEGDPVLVVQEVTHSPTGLAARVCLAGVLDDGGAASLDAASIVASFGSTALTPNVTGSCFELQASLPPGKHSLRVAASTRDGRELAPLWLPLWVEAEPFDWRRAVLYSVMIDRFADSDGRAEPTPDAPAISNYQGGDLAGVTRAIEEGWFSALGVDALWLSPVLDNAEGAFIGIDGEHLYSGYHGYWPVSATRLEPRFGAAGDSAEAALRALVETAHAHGMRVLLDAVLNHAHEQHPYCTELGLCRTTCVCGTAGCDWEARARDCQFASYLPDLDYRDVATRTRVVADLLALVAAYDIDGLRLDAVKHMDDQVLAAVRGPLDALAAAGGAPFWLVGETFTGGDGRALVTASLDPGELDGMFDFPLYWTLRDTFVNDGSFRALESAVVASESAYTDHLALMSPFLGNQDVERLATALARNDLGPWGGTADLLAATSGSTPTRWDIINPMSQAMAFLLTMRGVPLIYYGDELGLGGSNDPDNRRQLPRALSPDQTELLRRVRELGAARRAHPVLALGARRELWLDDDVYVQGRWRSQPAGVVIIAMNKGTEARTLTLTLPPELAADGGTFVGLLSPRSVSALGDQLTLTLDPWEYVLLELR